jgi:hypothetical protein
LLLVFVLRPAVELQEFCGYRDAARCYGTQARLMQSDAGKGGNGHRVWKPQKDSVAYKRDDLGNASQPFTDTALDVRKS